MAAPRRREKTSTGGLADAGALVRDRRLQLGLTQLDLAELAGVGVSSVRGLEAGRESVTLVIALAVLEALGLGLGVGPRPSLRSARDVLLLEPR
ncbi:helix-turn-helix domain-containing protein [Modestobacter sp. Leaf380]|uniref:helix-turn-helix domain-containing protein n=1 Tax=Modestobacter sp. Leaf380 TaxID=1736356 RepID=UPI0006F1F9D8|nr:helix-turn-helix domain-containing protein [Modestobacter sp. Leaf380]KQS67663.1 hypothetical protein ASG41_22520 [Modestobacter sp. Leaf380]